MVAMRVAAATGLTGCAVAACAAFTTADTVVVRIAVIVARAGTAAATAAATGTTGTDVIAGFAAAAATTAAAAGCAVIVLPARAAVGLITARTAAASVGTGTAASCGDRNGRSRIKIAGCRRRTARAAAVTVYAAELGFALAGPGDATATAATATAAAVCAVGADTCACSAAAGATCAATAGVISGTAFPTAAATCAVGAVAGSAAVGDQSAVAENVKIVAGGKVDTCCARGAAAAACTVASDGNARGDVDITGAVDLKTAPAAGQIAVEGAVAGEVNVLCALRGTDPPGIVGARASDSPSGAVPLRLRNGGSGSRGQNAVRHGERDFDVLIHDGFDNDVIADVILRRSHRHLVVEGDADGGTRSGVTAAYGSEVFVLTLLKGLAAGGIEIGVFNVFEVEQNALDGVVALLKAADRNVCHTEGNAGRGLRAVGRALDKALVDLDFRLCKVRINVPCRSDGGGKVIFRDGIQVFVLAPRGGAPLIKGHTDHVRIGYEGRNAVFSDVLGPVNGGGIRSAALIIGVKLEGIVFVSDALGILGQSQGSQGVRHARDHNLVRKFRGAGHHLSDPQIEGAVVVGKIVGIYAVGDADGILERTRRVVQFEGDGRVVIGNGGKGLVPRGSPFPGTHRIDLGAGGDVVYEDRHSFGRGSLVLLHKVGVKRRGAAGGLVRENGTDFAVVVSQLDLCGGPGGIGVDRSA